MSLAIEAAAGWVDITPDTPIPLCGFSRWKPFEGIDDRMEVNALLLGDGQTRLAIVSCDLLFIGDELRERVLRSLTTDLGADCLLLVATHTHYVPMTLREMPELGPVNDQYLDSVARKIAALLDSLAGRLRRATLRVCLGSANHGINRRLLRWRIWKNGITHCSEMGPNWSGSRDESVRVLRIEGADGSTIGLLWNYACHPTGYHREGRITAEFARGEATQEKILDAATQFSQPAGQVVEGSG